MTLAVTVKAEQGKTLVGAIGVAADVSVEQGRVLVAGSAPATEIEVEQAVTLVAGLSGSGGNHRLRSWTCTLDGHDFLIMRLGETYTLVYDFSTESWSKWASNSKSYFKPHVGLNWFSMNSPTLASNAVTNVVCGDDTTEYLYTFNPYIGYDEDADLTPLTFTREVLGGLPIRTRKTQPIGAAYLTIDSGLPQVTGAYFNLKSSDNFGRTWTDHGNIVSVSGDYDQEFSWRSLGLMKAPGKAFKITDNGAAVRIDSLEIR